MKCYKLFGRVRGIFPVKNLDSRRGIEIQIDGMPNYFTLKQAEKLLVDLQKAVNHAKGANNA